MDMFLILGNKIKIERIKLQLPFVFRIISDYNGLDIGIIGKKFNGNIEDAVNIAKDISDIMFNIFPNASNIQSIIGIINEKGTQLNISPNFRNIYEIQDNKGFNIFKE